MHLFSRNIIPLVLLALVSVLSGCEQGLLGSTDEQSDAVAVDYALAYVKRPVPTDDDGDPVSQDLREVAEFNPGAQLIIRDRAAVSADDQVITDGVFAGGELYDVKDLRVS